MRNGPDSDNLIGIRKLISEGKLVEASGSLRHLIENQPRNAEVWHLMAKVARLAGKLELASKMIETGLALEPNTPEFLVEKAALLNELGRSDDAMACHQKVLEFDPKNYESHAALGRHDAAHGKLESAYRHLRSAAQLRPEVPEIHNLLGQVLLDAGVLKEAQNAFLTCLEIDPRHLQALLRLGNLHRERNETGQAIEYYERALTVKPRDPYILSNLGNAWLDLGEPAEAIAHYEQSLREYPGAITTHSNLIFALHYQSGVDPKTIADAHKVWGKRHTNRLARVAAPPNRDLSADRPLRLGLVSADFRQHPVGGLVQILCSYLDSALFKIYVYDNGLRADGVTEHLQSLVPDWRKIGHLDDEKTVRLMQEDKIDILVDLSGHTSGHRLLVFARHPAPIQVAVFAYPNTTGMEAMDYRITDPQADPPGQTGHHYSEKLVHLSKTAWVYMPPKNAPEPQPGPLLAGRPAVFGCLNNPAKISRAAIQLWSTLLQQLPESRLMLLIRDEKEHAQRLRQKFTEAGARLDQLWLVPRAPLNTYLQYHQEVDLMLDPFPYNGGVSTCDALWMGVPVLTLAGDAYLSRQGCSLLSNAGLPQCIAATPAGLIQKAVGWVRSPERMGELRHNLREKMRQSPLLAYSAYAAELGDIFRCLWKEYCLKSPAH